MPEGVLSLELPAAAKLRTDAAASVPPRVSARKRPREGRRFDSDPLSKCSGFKTRINVFASAGRRASPGTREVL